MEVNPEEVQDFGSKVVQYISRVCIESHLFSTLLCKVESND